MADPSSAKLLAPVQPNKPDSNHTMRLAPTLPVFATTTPGDENMPDPICEPTTKAMPLISPMLFSATTLLTSSGSLKLAVNGKRSLSKLKLDIENERPLCRAGGAIPSSSSRALKESSES